MTIIIKGYNRVELIIHGGTRHRLAGLRTEGQHSQWSVSKQCRVMVYVGGLKAGSMVRMEVNVRTYKSIVRTESLILQL